MEYGDIMNRRSDAGGGSNLTLDFIQELQVSTGGYRAEFGGAMGGVINVVTKSGSNDLRGSAFSYWSPYWMATPARSVQRRGVALVGTDKPDYDTNVGVEVGGPIVRNKLFFWVGFAPRLEKTHFFRDLLPFEDADGDGMADIDPNTGEPRQTLVDRTRTNQYRRAYQMGGKIDFLPLPNHRLTLSMFSTPSRTRHARGLFPGTEAVNDPMWAQQQLNKTNTDVILGYVAHFLDDRWRVEANVGLHREDFSDKSPFGNLNDINQIEWRGASLADVGTAGDMLHCARSATGFDPCPVDVYHVGGYGLAKTFVGNRWMGELKSTNRLGPHELKYGLRGEWNQFNQTRFYSGPRGSNGRGLIQHQPDGTTWVWNFFTLPEGVYPSQFTDAAANNPDPNMDGQLNDLAGAPYYQDQLVAKVKSINAAYFIQDSYHVLPNLTLDAGVRLDNQRVYDFRGNQFLNLYNFGPRVGVVYDPSNEGRSKLYGHYGRFYETIPMNLAARYFGGEGILIRVYDQAACPSRTWTGQGGEWNSCESVGGFTANNGGAYPVQPRIKGQFHDEIVAGLRHALTENLVVGLDYTHRWLGRVIEDGAADGSNFVYVLGNPGQVPRSAIDDTQRDIDAKQGEVAAAMGGGDPALLAKLTAQLNDLRTKKKNLETIAEYPKPQRTYDAITVSASKRMSRNWLLNAQYTYSRLIGNYNGLYDADISYFAPNGGTQFDTPDLVLNKKGPLANDRPHSGRVDAFGQIPAGNGTLMGGISFSAYSGIPRNHVSALYDGGQLVFLLPRGSAGRTPTVTQVDFKVAYRHQLSQNVALEAFIDFFNLFNKRTPLRVDDDYTLDVAAPIVNGTTEDLKYAKNGAGQPVNKNPNFGNGTLFQAPFHGRLGVRVFF
jgi:hypothetical protein